MFGAVLGLARLLEIGIGIVSLTARSDSLSDFESDTADYDSLA
jgi:hypothetical protein